MSLTSTSRSVVLIISLLLAGCISVDRPPTDATSNEQEPELVFDLPSSFRVQENENYTFFARSSAPRALFTIQEADVHVVEYEPRPGESISGLDLEGVEAVVVSNAALKDLPDYLIAYELLITNGEQSFSVIMSGDRTALAPAWEHFIGSVTLASA